MRKQISVIFLRYENRVHVMMTFWLLFYAYLNTQLIRVFFFKKCDENDQNNKALIITFKTGKRIFQVWLIKTVFSNFNMSYSSD